MLVTAALLRWLGHTQVMAPKVMTAVLIMRLSRQAVGQQITCNRNK